MESEEAKRNYKIVAAAQDDLYRGCESKDWSAYKLPKPLVVLWAVTQMHGKVCNGGYPCFFEADWPGKPPYSFFIGGLKHIGAQEAAGNLTKAVALFPFPEPHLDYKKRREFMDECEVRDGKGGDGI